MNESEALQEALQEICKIIFPNLNLTPNPPPETVVGIVRHLKENTERLKEIGEQSADLAKRIKVVLVKYRQDPRVPRHGATPPFEYQAKIVSVNGETKWLEYPNVNEIYPRDTAMHRAKLLGVRVDELDNTNGWGEGGTRQ